MPDLETVVAGAVRRLQAAGVDGARRDARLLIASVLDLSMADMIAHTERPVDDPALAEINRVISLRADRVPVSRILGEREFRGLPFSLSPGTLDPRPDSEAVVEHALRLLGERPAPRVLDLGTGTGCLLLSILAERSDATGLGVDVSDDALATAAVNAQRLGLAGRVRFCPADWMLENWFRSLPLPFDLVISNPPYIVDGEIETLAPEVRCYDPLRALAGGQDGLDAYRRLIPFLPDLLSSSGWCVFEVGIGQAGQVADLLGQNGLDHVQIEKDLGGVERSVAGQYV